MSVWTDKHTYLATVDNSDILLGPVVPALRNILCGVIRRVRHKLRVVDVPIAVTISMPSTTLPKTT